MTFSLRLASAVPLADEALTSRSCASASRSRPGRPAGEPNVEDIRTP